MAFDPITAVADLAGKVIDRVVPDPAAKAAAALQLAQLQQSGELAQLAASTDLVKGQLATNTAEASSSSVFVSGWRPFVGWICGGGLAVQFLVRPFFIFGANLLHHSADFPTLDMSTLLTLLGGLLGLGTLRTVEKINGVATVH